MMYMLAAVARGSLGPAGGMLICRQCSVLVQLAASSACRRGRGGSPGRTPCRHRVAVAPMSWSCPAAAFAAWTRTMPQSACPISWS